MYKNSYCLNETLFPIVDLVVVVVVVAFVDWETFVALALVLVWSGWKDYIVSHRVTLLTHPVIVVVAVVVVFVVVVVAAAVVVVVLWLVDLLVIPHFGCTYPYYLPHLQDIDNFVPPPMVVVATKDIQKVDKVVVVMMVVIVMMVLIVPTRGQQRWWG